LRKFLAVAGIALIAALAWLAWPWLEDRRGGFGEPTALAPGETPLAALCRVRAAFLALPEPAYAGFDRHERWTRTRFAAGTFTYGPYWEIRPAAETKRYTRAHSRLEIVAAVGPYLGDPALAPKAAAVLAALPVATRQGLESLQDYANLLAEKGAREPGARPSWDIHDRRKALQSILTLYGSSNGADRLDAGRAAAPAGTLEHALLQVLADRDRLSGPARLFPDVVLTEREGVRDWNAAIARGAPAAPDTRFTAFTGRWPRDWLLAATFPYALHAEPRGGSGIEQLMWIAGLQEKYWPLTAITRSFATDQEQAAYEAEIGALARATCGGTPK